MLFEPHPAMNRPTISIDETARKKQDAVLRSATPIPGANGIGREDQQARHEEDDRREVEDRAESAESGIEVSFNSSLTPSAIGCSSPCGPTRYGPMRDCIRAANLRSSSVT